MVGVSREYGELRPSGRVAAYVECYWSSEERPGSRIQNVLPDGCVDILFSTRNGEPAELTLVGLMTAPHTYHVQAGDAFFGVRFRPGMASAFIPEASALSDTVEPLESFWGAKTRLLLEQLAETSSFEMRSQIAERFLRPAQPPDPAQRALYRLSMADQSLERVTADAGLSARHFRRVCLERAGVSPKYLSRILRFRKAVERIRALEANRAQPNWAHFAAACGYYDQAHCIREFQEFSGLTPGRFLQARSGGGP